jgi:hypothetical protein
VAFFGALFAARTDDYAIRYDNRRTGKTGWVGQVAPVSPVRVWSKRSRSASVIVATAPLCLLAHDAQQLRRAYPDAVHDHGQDLNVLVGDELGSAVAPERRGSHGSRDGALRESA